MHSRYPSRSVRTILVLILAVSLYGCRNGKAPQKPQREHPGPAGTEEEIFFEFPDTGRYYRMEIEGKNCFVFLEHADGKNATGHCYVADNDSIAFRHPFSVKVTRSKLVWTSGEKTSRISPKDIRYSPYEEPEFIPMDCRPYRECFCSVDKTTDISYGQALGYWTTLQGAEANVMRIFTQGYVKSFIKNDLDLTLDLYRPDSLAGARPLIMFIHGGAFYVGDKQEPAYVDFCRHFASMGYVTASINYRLGFHINKKEIERAAYRAVQDAHAAMRFLVSNASEYGIDTSELFLAGSSAGGITALNLAFLKEEDRPESSYRTKGLVPAPDLGPIDSSGNTAKADFSIRAIANMWGAMTSTDLLMNSRTDIISFYGDKDDIVPFDNDYPFLSAGEGIAKKLSDPMYGSVCIDSKARERGLRSELHVFPGEGHALNTTGKEKLPNQYHYQIRDAIAKFFFREMVPVEVTILNDYDGIFFTECRDIGTITWKVEGGFIESIGERSIHVIWRNDAVERKLTASGTYGNGIGFLSILDMSGGSGD